MLNGSWSWSWQEDIAGTQAQIQPSKLYVVKLQHLWHSSPVLIFPVIVSSATASVLLSSQLGTQGVQRFFIFTYFCSLTLCYCRILHLKASWHFHLFTSYMVEHFESILFIRQKLVLWQTIWLVATSNNRKGPAECLVHSNPYFPLKQKYFKIEITLFKRKMELLKFRFPVLSSSQTAILCSPLRRGAENSFLEILTVSAPFSEVVPSTNFLHAQGGF